jgi:hypothetical protein
MNPSVIAHKVDRYRGDLYPDYLNHGDACSCRRGLRVTP